MTDRSVAEAALTLYSTSTCGPCIRLKMRLADLGIAFDEVDVEVDEAAGVWVSSVNAGDRVVPTVRFVDGSWLTNPSVEAVVERLAALGR